jgi:hypothetical protein
MSKNLVYEPPEERIQKWRIGGVRLVCYKRHLQWL